MKIHHPRPSALLRASLALALVLSSAAAWAQEQGGQFVTRGGITVHYAAINTTDVPAATATALGITRSASQAILVLNGQRPGDDGALQSIPLQAEGSIENLVGQAKAFAPRTVQEADTWYLIAPFRIADGEQLRFDLQVRAEGAQSTIPLRFQQAFYRPR